MTSRQQLLAILGAGIVFLAAVAATWPAKAQGIVATTPFQATTAITSGSITSTNTFQSALASNASRRGCLLQNLGSNTMFVYVGALTSATTPQSLQLSTKQTFNCAAGGIVVTDQIAVTGTSGDGFVVLRQ